MLGEQIALFPEKPLSAGEKLRRVAKLLASGRWHSGPEICDPNVGGSEGLRRLRELRAQGWDIEKRRIPNSDAFEYRVRCRP